MRHYNPISGLFIIFFLVCAGILAVIGAVQASEKIEPLRIDNVLNGKWAVQYETVFNKTLDIYEPSVATWGILNYYFFDEGRDGVLIGDDGWLFTKEEFNFTPAQDEIIQRNLQYVKHVQDKLSEKDIRLLVALVPAKARLYEDELGRYEFPSYQETVYNDALRSLQESGVVVADLYAAMESSIDKDSLFLKTDTHWSPYGAEIAAKAIRGRIAREWPDMNFQKYSYKTFEKEPVVHEGDLLRYIPLGLLADEIGPEPDRIVFAETEKSDRDADNIDQNALFEDADYPVALVGTSYSANAHWNFEGYLKENLQTDILNAAQEGRGPFEAMKEYLEDESLKENPPDLVIWEIPERYLSFSYNIAMY